MTKNAQETWRPRQSVCARLQCDDDNPLNLLQPSNLESFFPRKFKRALCSEARQILTDLGEELTSLSLPGLEHVTVVLDDSDWGTAGKAELDEEGTLTLSLSFGFVLAVEEATLEFIAHDDALCPIAMLVSPNGKTAAAQCDCYTYEAIGEAKRFVDYRCLRDHQFIADHVTSGFPSTLWRLRQQDLLFTLALRWAALHEIAHGALHHIELLSSFFGDQTGRISLVETDPTDESNVYRDVWSTFGYPAAPDLKMDEAYFRKALELHADTCALWLSFDLERWERRTGHGLFTQFENDMSQLVDDPNDHFCFLSPDQRVHFLLLSALVAIMLLNDLADKEELKAPTPILYRKRGSSSWSGNRSTEAILRRSTAMATSLFRFHRKIFFLKSAAHDGLALYRMGQGPRLKI